MKFSGRKLGLEICEALKLEPAIVRSLTLRCTLNAPATIEVEMLVETADQGDIGSILKRYELVERNQ